MIYSIQVIAREDKGWRGVEYNKSPETFFKTSRKKKDLSPVKIQDINRGVEAVKVFARKNQKDEYHINFVLQKIMYYLWGLARMASST